MATITKRNGRWQARVRRKGFPTQTKTFSQKKDAQIWVRHVEVKNVRGFSFISTRTSVFLLFFLKSGFPIFSLRLISPSQFRYFAAQAGVAKRSAMMVSMRVILVFTVRLPA